MRLVRSLSTLSQRGVRREKDGGLERSATVARRRPHTADGILKPVSTVKRSNTILQRLGSLRRPMRLTRSMSQKLEVLEEKVALHDDSEDKENEKA